VEAGLVDRVGHPRQRHGILGCQREMAIGPELAQRGEQCLVDRPVEVIRREPVEVRELAGVEQHRAEHRLLGTQQRVHR
jgi:hypothetical protein